MLYRSIAAGACLGLSVFALTLVLPTPAEALAGCCKMRQTADGQWSITKASVQDCKSQNAARDNDNLVKPTGFVWWDIAC